MIVALIEALRPKQWTKNLLLFAGVLFSQNIQNLDLMARVVAGVVAFSLLSGTVYLLNDLKDVEADRRHPKKRLRPIASGRLPIGVAWAAIVPLLAVVAGIGWWLGPGFMLTAGMYFASSLAYTFGLKHQVILDVFIIALGFVLRAIAGVQVMIPLAPDTRLSPWLLVCTFFGALFLAVAKRRRELTNAGESAVGQRAVLERYTPELLESLLMVSAAASVMGYALYTMWPGTVERLGTESLLYTVPFVAYGIFRYLFLVRVSETAEDPSAVLLTDRPLALCLLLYVAAVVAILYHS